MLKSDAQRKRESIARRKALHQNIEFFDGNYPQLVKDYPEQWVAVRNHEVIDSDPDMRKLVDRVHDQGIPLRTTLINFVTAKKTRWVFAT